MRRWFLVTLVMVVLGAPIALARQKVSIDYDKAHDFSRIRSFAMQIATSWGNPLGEKRVLEAVGQALVAKGWTRQDGAAADSVRVPAMRTYRIAVIAGDGIGREVTPAAIAVADTWPARRERPWLSSTSPGAATTTWPRSA